MSATARQVCVELIATEQLLIRPISAHLCHLRLLGRSPESAPHQTLLPVGSGGRPGQTAFLCKYEPQKSCSKVYDAATRKGCSRTDRPGPQASDSAIYSNPALRKPSKR